MIPPPKRTSRRGPPKATARQRVLAQWRGVDTTPMQVAAITRAQKAGDLLPKMLADYRIEGRRSEAEIVKVWNDLIDPAIVAHAQPAGLRKGTLFVVVDNSMWHYEIILYRRHEILERMQSSFGPEVIKKISYRVG